MVSYLAKLITVQDATERQSPLGLRQSDQLEVLLAISSSVVLSSLSENYLPKRHDRPHLQYCRRVIIALKA